MTTYIRNKRTHTVVLGVCGRLGATRGQDGLWRSTRQWVDEYKKTRYQRQ